MERLRKRLGKHCVGKLGFACVVALGVPAVVLSTLESEMASDFIVLLTGLTGMIFGVMVAVEAGIKKADL